MSLPSWNRPPPRRTEIVGVTTDRFSATVSMSEKRVGVHAPAALERKLECDGGVRGSPRCARDGTGKPEAKAVTRHCACCVQAADWCRRTDPHNPGAGLGRRWHSRFRGAEHYKVKRARR